MINAEDMLYFLTAYNTQWGPDLNVPCDYQGSDLETLFADLINGDAQLDSLYFAYSVYDSASVYLPDCPDPVTVFNLVERTGMIRNFEQVTLGDGRLAVTSGEEIDGHYVFFDWRFNPDFAVYSLEFGDAAIVAESAPSLTGYGTTPTTTLACLSLPSGVSMNWASTSRPMPAPSGVRRFSVCALLVCGRRVSPFFQGLS